MPALELDLATWRFLDASAELTALLGESAMYPKWLFREAMFVDVEQTGQSAVVVSQRGTWQPPTDWNTSRYPRLQIEIYSDVPRNPNGTPAVAVPRDSAVAVFNVVDSLLHQPAANGERWFDALRIFSCQRLGEPDYVPVPGKDSVVRGLAYYGVYMA